MNSVSQAGINFIKGWEKYYSRPYDATGRGDWTIGWGHKMTKGESYPNGITPDQAQALFLSDLASKAMNPINNLVTTSLSQQQYDA